MKHINTVVRSFSVVIIAAATTACGGEDLGLSPANQPNTVRVDPETLDSLPPGEHMQVNLSSQMVYEFDQSRGPLDFRRITLVSDTEEIPMTTWTRALPGGPPLESFVLAGDASYLADLTEESLLALEQDGVCEQRMDRSEDGIGTSVAGLSGGDIGCGSYIKRCIRIYLPYIGKIDVYCSYRCAG